MKPLKHISEILSTMVLNETEMPSCFEKNILHCPICGNPAVTPIYASQVNTNDKSTSIVMKFECDQEHVFYRIIENHKGVCSWSDYEVNINILGGKF